LEADGVIGRAPGKRQTDRYPVTISPSDILVNVRVAVDEIAWQPPSSS